VCACVCAGVRVCVCVCVYMKLAYHAELTACAESAVDGAAERKELAFDAPGHTCVYQQ